MIFSFALILGFQILGEAIVRLFGLPVPGPVLGMVLMLFAFFLKDDLVDGIRPTAGVLLANMSLLFVPAGVGIMRHGERFMNEGVGIAVTLVASTLIAMAVSGYVILLVQKVLKIEDDE
ncbi:CidA/LrgA family protein [Sutterella massiliensis]|uniref:CidA/LrgA family protein n=1 Tax=Sutterella massiliensis TaxID=1816689 RepID=A0ABS2DS37_9BURK|nr:CidA/LrgA family protein [Sutterella massiliensis]MBM6704161.1 CidA/LrgA family protein [Sutterella massiliensis]